MPNSPAVKASSVQYDGVVPPFTQSSGRLTNAASAQYGFMIVAPCDLYIERVFYVIDTQFTHASSAITFGTVADPDSHIDSFNIQNAAAGTYELDMANAAVLNRTILKGSAVAFGLDAADTTGKISITAVLRPANQG